MAEWQTAQSKSQERRLRKWPKRDANPGSKAERGQRYPEWQCSARGCDKRTFVWQRNGEPSSCCRRCHKTLDPTLDKYINEYGQHTEWPASFLKQNAPPAAYSAGTQLTQARKQLATAEREGFPTAVLDMIREDIRKLEEAEREDRPLGQRLDQARAQLRKAVDRAEQAEEELSQAQQAMAEAEEEVQRWHAEVQKLTAEAASIKTGRTADQSMIRSLVSQLASLSQAAEATWTDRPAPDRLATVLQASNELIADMTAMQQQPGPEDDDAEDCAGQTPVVDVDDAGAGDGEDADSQMIEESGHWDDTELPHTKRETEAEAVAQPPPPKRREVTFVKGERMPAARSYAAVATAGSAPAVAATASSDARGSAARATASQVKPDARLKETLDRARRFIRPMQEVMKQNRERSPRRGPAAAEDRSGGF